MQVEALAMQYLKGHTLSSLIPRHGEEGLSQVAQTQAGQKYWYRDRTSSTCFLAPVLVRLVPWISHTGHVVRGSQVASHRIIQGRCISEV